jgi:hypothetical protein
MGFLDALRGKKPDLRIETDPPEAVPGAEVRVRVVVEGEVDGKAQGGRAGLRCVNEYLRREYDRRDEEWDEVWRSVTLHEEAQELPLRAGRHEFAFRVPEGLPPDSAKAVSWWAWATIERRRGIDANASARLPVRLPAAATPSGRRSVQPNEDGIAFDDLPASVGAGQTLDGRLSVTAGDDLNATGVRVKLSRYVTYASGDQRIVKHSGVAEVEVAGDQSFAAGQTQAFPFSVPVPPDPGPTAEAPHAVVEWVVTGVVARRMRDDLEAHAPVVVYDAP